MTSLNQEIIPYSAHLLTKVAYDIANGYIDHLKTHIGKKEEKTRKGVYLMGSTPFEINTIANELEVILSNSNLPFKPGVLVQEPENPLDYQAIDIDYILPRTK